MMKVMIKHGSRKPFRFLKSERFFIGLIPLFLLVSACTLPSASSPPVIIQEVEPLPTLAGFATVDSTSSSSIDPAEVVQAPDTAPATLTPEPTEVRERPTPVTFSGVPTADAPFYDDANSGFLSYTIVGGDTLFRVATRFGIPLEELLEINSLTENSVIVVGEALKIPVELSGTGPSWKIIPDSELVYGPTVEDFNTGDYLRRFFPQSTLLRYQESVEGRPMNGAAVVELVAIRFSINPRLLLAMIEHRSGWVTRPVPNFEEDFYPMGIVKSGQEGLYNQLSVAANLVNFGYYGRAEGGLRTIDFDDGTKLLINPTINHGTAGVQVWLAGHSNAFPQTWRNEAGPEGFNQTYESLFGNPFGFALDGPLLPEGLTQPELTFPWEPGIAWYFTGGPHGGWAGGSAWAALDFGPDKEKRGCYLSEQWVVAATGGTVVYSNMGGVLLDLDGDGDPGTGWVLVHWHVDQAGRVENGTELSAGDRIGHPSCEGGFSNGTHLHFARRYNGRWIGADGDIPFVLDGWTSSGAGREYDGYLVKAGESKEACVCAEEINELIR